MSQGDWQRPEGLTKGTWDYIRSHSIADGYDKFLHNDPLTLLDWQVVQRHFSPIASGSPKRHVVEFGCGTGRTLLPLAKMGYETTGIDLSFEMLKQFRQKSIEESLQSSCHPIAANLTELSGFNDQVFDHGVCLFSTLGMIKDRSQRATFLNDASRTIRKGGKFIVHAHRAMFQVRQVGGLKWFATSLFKAAIGEQEFGDRYADYRGINDFFIHSYRLVELRQELTDNGFEIVEENPLVHGKNELELGSPTKRSSILSTVGWIVVCTVR